MNTYYTELADHEYRITYDLMPAFNAPGLTIEQVNADKRLLRGFKKARKAYLKDCQCLSLLEV